MKNYLKSGTGLGLLILSACTLHQVPDTIPPQSTTWYSQNLVADIFLPVEQMVPAVEVTPFKQRFFTEMLTTPTGATMIDQSKSVLTVQVNKAGLLASIGHQHVIASRDLEGWIDEKNGRGFFSFSIAKMTVDESDLLIAKSLPNPISEEAKAGTKSNMLKMLDVKQFPDVRVLVERFDADKSLALVKIWMNDHIVAKDIPVNVLRSANKIVAINGQASLKLKDFSVEPFSAFAGLLSVDNEMQIELDIRM